MGAQILYDIKQSWLTFDSKVYPAAILKWVGLLLQHQDPALIPALVCRAHLLDPQWGLPLECDSTYSART